MDAVSKVGQADRTYVIRIVGGQEPGNAEKNTGQVSA